MAIALFVLSLIALVCAVVGLFDGRVPWHAIALCLLAVIAMVTHWPGGIG